MAEVFRSFLLLSYLVVCSVYRVDGCTKLSDCSCKKSNGKIISLKPIDSKSGPKFSDIKEEGQPYTFKWNPCTKFNGGSGCDGVLLCQRSGGANYPVARTAQTFTDGSSGSIILTYEAVSYEGFKRLAVIVLKCDESKYPGEFSEFTEKPGYSSSQYEATFTSKCVCDDGCADVPRRKGSKKQRLSMGSILLIVFFLLIFVYFVAGILYNKYHKGADTFPEIIPNHSFWSGFPFLVKDGCVFTFQCISGCCSSLCMKLKGDSYAKI